jgi:hypothetical protein
MLDLPKDYQNSRVWIFGVLVLLGLVLAMTLLQLTCRTPEDVERIIESSPGLIEHDKFCRSIPLPSDFELESRSLGGNSYTTAIGYTFRSRKYFSEVRDFFTERLEAEGWTQTNATEGSPTRGANGMSFSKDTYRVSIYIILAAGSGHAGEYSMYCGKVLGSRSGSLVNRR